MEPVPAEKLKPKITEFMGKKNKKKERQADGFSRGSGIDYSKTADRHVDDKRFEGHRTIDEQLKKNAASTATKSNSTPSTEAPAPQTAAISGTMESVMRLMAGMDERSIKDKLADANRPTWEQYKKDNADKLDISGVDAKKMKEYRDQLDADRAAFLNRGLNHGDKNKKSKKKKKEKKKKHKKKKSSKKRHRSSSSSSSDDSSSDSDSESSGDDKRKSKKSKKDDDRGHRLSSFFTE